MSDPSAPTPGPETLSTPTDGRPVSQNATPPKVPSAPGLHFTKGQIGLCLACGLAFALFVASVPQQHANLKQFLSPERSQDAISAKSLLPMFFPGFDPKLAPSDDPESQILIEDDVAMFIQSVVAQVLPTFISGGSFYVDTIASSARTRTS